MICINDKIFHSIVNGKIRLYCPLLLLFYFFAMMIHDFDEILDETIQQEY